MQLNMTGEEKYNGDLDACIWEEYDIIEAKFRELREILAHCESPNSAIELCDTIYHHYVVIRGLKSQKIDQDDKGDLDSDRHRHDRIEDK